MYGKDFFIRFVDSRSHAECDLKRGYSFSQYALFATRNEAVEFWSDQLQRDVEASEIGYQRGAGYGLRLAGLCGFGPFESIEEAREFAQNRRGYNGVRWPCAAIFVGQYLGQADGGDGDMFRVAELVEIIKF